MRKAVIFLVAVLANVNLTFANASSSVELNSPSKKELFEQKSLEKDITSYIKIVENPDYSQHSMVELALFTQEIGFSFGELQKYEDALSWYDKTIEKFKDFTQVEIKEVVAGVMFNKALIYVRQNRYDDALCVLHELKDTYKNTHSEYLDLHVSNANMAVAEIELMTDKPISKPNSKELLDEHKSLFEMLTILNMAKIKSQDKEIAQWKMRNQHLKYTDWTFDWIEDWAKANNYQSEKKERINKTLGVLLSHIEAR